jgi:hypothetical protein
VFYLTNGNITIVNKVGPNVFIPPDINNHTTHDTRDDGTRTEDDESIMELDSNSGDPLPKELFSATIATALTIFLLGGIAIAFILYRQ